MNVHVCLGKETIQNKPNKWNQVDKKKSRKETQRENNKKKQPKRSH